MRVSGHLKPDARHPSSQGFTLLELLVATMLLSIGLLGIGRLAISVMNGHARSEKLTTATVLAQDALEQLKTPAPGSNSDSTFTEDYNTIPGHPMFKRVRSVEANSPATGLQRLTVTVFWDADSRSTSLKSIRR